MGNGHSILTVFDHVAGRIAITGVRLYQVFGARLANRTCLFSPTCSRYAIQVLSRFGFSIGWALTRRRLAICHGNFSMRLAPAGGVELVTSSGRVVRQQGVNPVIARRILSFGPTTGQVQEVTATSDRMESDTKKKGAGSSRAEFRNSPTDTQTPMDGFGI